MIQCFDTQTLPHYKWISEENETLIKISRMQTNKCVMALMMGLNDLINKLLLAQIQQISK